MGQNFLYKILSILLLVLIVVLSLLQFNVVKDTITTLCAIYMGGVVIISFFLSALLFWLASTKIGVKTIYLEKEEKIKKEKKESTSELSKEKEQQAIAEKSGSLLFDLDTQITHEEFTEQLLRNFAEEFSIVQGIAFVREDDVFKKSASYALYSLNEVKSFVEGEGITGQVAKNKEILNISQIPENYITVLSGLGNSSPKNLLIIPIVLQEKTVAILELASFSNFPDYINKIYQNISQALAEKIAEFL